MVQDSTTSVPPSNESNDIPPPLTLNGLNSTPRRRNTRRSTIGDAPAASARQNSLSESVHDATATLRSGITSDTPGSTWHSVSLAFAVLPALAGLLVSGGNMFVTDILLLFLVAVFLHWLVKFPWEWYHSSQAIMTEQDGPGRASSTFAAPPKLADTSAGGSGQRLLASRELARNEMMALVCCFVGPCLGGWLLHTVRSHLSSPSEGLISNFNVTIFVLTAELRPAAHVVKLMRCRSLYLQSLVHQPPRSRVEDLESKVQELSAKVKELSMLTARAIERDPDLDALNRAVRRYEKKEALHSAQTETRIMEIDNRLNDVLTLAAAASARQQPDTFTAILLNWMYAMIIVPFSVIWRIVSLPARAVETTAGMTTGRLIYSQRQRQKRGGQGRVNGTKAGKG